MIRLKPGVKLKNLQPQTVLLIVAMDAAYQYVGLKNCVVTSCNDGTHMPESKHYAGEAADFRTHNLRAYNVNPVIIVQLVRDCLGGDFDVILEGAGTPNEHIHGEYDPK